MIGTQHLKAVIIGVGALTLIASNAAVSSAQPDTDATQTEEYLNYIIDDLDKYWTDWMTKSGYSEPYVLIKMISPGVNFPSECGNYDSDHPNAYYCPSDVSTLNGEPSFGSIILPVDTFTKMWTGDVLNRQSVVSGDFAAAIIVAHEFGHHIQDEIWQQYIALGYGNISEPANTGNKELIADCFAGSWAAAGYYSGLLTDTDYEEAVAAIQAIADPPDVGGNHGTAEQRASALEVGYNADADPQICIATYWP